MTYKVTVFPLRGYKITKELDGIRELHHYLNECSDNGYDIKSVRRVRTSVVQLAQVA